MALLDSFTGSGAVGSGILIFVMGYLGTIFYPILQDLWALFERQFYVQATIRSQEPLFDWVKVFLAQHPYSKRSNQVIATTSLNLAEDMNTAETIGSQRNKSVMLLPSPGLHVFFHKGRLLWMRYMSNTDSSMGGRGGNNTESITITVLGRNRKFLLDLFHEAKDMYFKRERDNISIFVPDSYCEYWVRGISKPKRRLSSVILRDGVMEELLVDIRTFMASELWYADMGIPFHRGYLLYGPPGTGKTSTITAIAGELGLNLCLINLSEATLTDMKLQRLLSDAPDNSIILLEDVDVAFSSAATAGSGGSGLKGGMKDLSNSALGPVEDKNLNGGADDQDMSMMGAADPMNRLTLSGLLNSIDGVNTSEGRIFFMTTNHLDRLAPALIRPGRVDVRTLIDFADHSQIMRLFMKFFPPWRHNCGSPADPPARSAAAISKKVDSSENSPTTPAPATAAAQRLVQNVGCDCEKGNCKRIEKMASTFADRLKSVIGSVSIAELQAYFVKHRTTPENALDGVDEILKGAHLVHNAVFANAKPSAAETTTVSSQTGGEGVTDK